MDLIKAGACTNFAVAAYSKIVQALKGTPYEKDVQLDLVAYVPSDPRFSHVYVTAKYQGKEYIIDPWVLAMGYDKAVYTVENYPLQGMNVFKKREHLHILKVAPEDPRQ